MAAHNYKDSEVFTYHFKTLCFEEQKIVDTILSRMVDLEGWDTHSIETVRKLVVKYLFLGDTTLCFISPETFAIPTVHYYVGIARCSPNDNYDSRLGGKIAFYRAVKKYVKEIMSLQE